MRIVKIQTVSSYFSKIKLVFFSVAEKIWELCYIERMMSLVTAQIRQQQKAVVALFYDTNLYLQKKWTTALITISTAALFYVTITRGEV